MSEAAIGVSAARAHALDPILVVGPSPPPWHGGSVATEYVLRSGLSERWTVLHLDTADRRGVANQGRLDFGNLIAAVVHGARFLAMLLINRPRIVYVPIAQNALGVLRDMLFILPALLMRRRLVLHVHGGGFGLFQDDASVLLRMMTRFALRHADRVIVLGESLRPTLRGAVPAERVRVLANGMPDVFTEAPVRAQHSALRVLFLGNLFRSKGPFDVIEAVRLMIERGLDVHLDIAGDWATAGDRDAAQPLLKALGTRVTVHGVVGPPAKRELLERADVLALPTYYECEAHPFVILEAMDAGLPVVTTAHGAIPETVLHDVTGLHVPPRDPAALAETLTRLARDPELRVRLGRAGRARFLEHYTLGTWSAGLVRVFEEAAA